MAFMRERVNWPATVAVSAAATLAASTAFHEIHFAEGSFMDGAQQFLTPDIFGVDYHTSTSAHRQAHHIVHRRSEQTPTSYSSYLDIGEQAYAADFSHDPAAGEYVQPDRLAGILEDIAGNVKLGYKVGGIKVTGFASAEDESHAPDGGLITPSEKNLRLAQKRADVVMRELRKAIEDDPELAKATRGVSFHYGPPVEQELTKKQLDRVEHMAHDAGFDDARQLIDAWNAGQADVPEADSAALADLLGKARKVDVSVAYHSTRDEIIDKKYCVQYDITDITTQKHHQRDPLPLPIPVIIPILRRRRGGSYAMEPDEPGEGGTGGPEPLTDRTDERADHTVAEGSDVLEGGSTGTYPEPEADVPATPSSDTAPERIGYTGGRANDDLAIRMGRYTVNGFLGLIAAGALLINISGENCHGDGHTPRPLLVDLVWETIDDATGRGADVSQEISLGIPFVSGAQLDLKSVDGNVWSLNGAKACERPSRSAIPAKPPRCSQVDIVRRNGKTVTKRTVYQAPPLSTHRTIKQHR